MQERFSASVWSRGDLEDHRRKFKSVKRENFTWLNTRIRAFFSSVAEPDPTAVLRDSMTFRPLTLAMEISSFSDSVSGPCVHANTRAVYMEVAAIKTIIVHRRCRSSVRYKCDLLDLSDFGGRFFSKASGRPSATASESRAQYYVHATRTLARHRDRRSDTDLYRPSGRDWHRDEGFGYPIRNRGRVHVRVLCVFWKNQIPRHAVRSGSEESGSIELIYKSLYTILYLWHACRNV